MIRLAHLSDLHIGARLTIGPGYAGAADVDPVEDPYRSLSAAFSRVLTGGYDAVLLAGDMFDRSADAGRPVTVFQSFLDALHQSGVPAVVISGNHDAETRLEASVALPPSATWLPADAAGTVVLDGLGLAVHGRSIDDPSEGRDLAASYPVAIRGLANVGLLHTSLGGDLSRRECAPTSVELLERAGYDYWALGHVHQRHAFGERGNVVYCGSPFGRRPTEHGGHGFAEVTLGEEGAVVRHVHTSTFRYEFLDLPDAADGACEAPRRGAAVGAANAVSASDDARGEAGVEELTLLWTMRGADEAGLALGRELAASGALGAGRHHVGAG